MNEKKIIFFDGVCNLCNGFVDYIIKRDIKKKIFFSSLQSDFAKSKLANYKIDNTSNYSTIYFLLNGKLLSQSSAILHILMELSPRHRILAKVCILLPKFIRDSIYNFIAKNRYLFFGKKETCRLPSPEEKNQFI